MVQFTYFFLLSVIKSFFHCYLLSLATQKYAIRNKVEMMELDSRDYDEYFVDGVESMKKLSQEEAPVRNNWRREIKVTVS